MYIVLVYDVEQKRVAKALKVCRGYLNWIQNSVFEGELTDGQYKELQQKLRKVISIKKDSVLFFKMNSETAFAKEIMGIEKAPTSNMI
ncbi:MAG TPA: CRISPR-associated endonuclease Cas2 [bacterium]|jgi:CRISPR-associated protein Cas2|nr:CRISPR-associated endonuclease Cas2 [bacterium]HOX86222.1 CRISPR-associated endonuclease Cas2 [bacterium]HPG45564.1 CRISPR-associated endonuclease Cas2 [bacterium]HPM97657.1 CRISPR-associated endonuclease Cas2 [bacterium]